MRLLSTRELADALAVSESSVKRWVDSGRIAGSRTAGGHRRIERAAALSFIRESGLHVARPELLDLPDGATQDRLLDYLLEGDAQGAGAWLVARYVEGATVAELGDGPIRHAMHALGEMWRHGDAGIYVEHRATDACLRAVAQLRAELPAPPPDAPCAVGGAPAGDPYLIPSQLAAMVATEGGMRAVNLGPDVPASVLEHAVDDLAPSLVWISASVAPAPARVRALATTLGAMPRSIAIVVGGQAASSLRVPERSHRAFAFSDLAGVVTQSSGSTTSRKKRT